MCGIRLYMLVVTCSIIFTCYECDKLHSAMFKIKVATNWLILIWWWDRPIELVLESYRLAGRRYTPHYYYLHFFYYYHDVDVSSIASSNETMIVYIHDDHRQYLR